MKRTLAPILLPVAAVVMLWLALSPPAKAPWSALAGVQPAAGQPSDEERGIEIGPDPEAPPKPPVPVPAPPAAKADEAKADEAKADIERERVIKRRLDLGTERGRRGGEIVRMGQDVEIEAGERVEEVVVIGGSLTVRGEVAGDAVAIGGNLDVKSGGCVGGDAVSIGGNLRVEPGGIVEGDEVQVGSFGPLFIPTIGSGHADGLGTLGRIAKSGLTLLVLLFIGWLAMVLFGDRLMSMADVLQDDFWRSLFIGVLVLVLWLPAVFLSAITVIGIPVAIVLVIGVPLAVFVGYLIGALAFGRRLVAGLHVNQGGAVMHLLAGLAAIGLLGVLGRVLGGADVLAPVAVAFRIASWVLLSFAAILGLGALTMAQVELVRARRSTRAVPPPPVPPGAEPGPPPSPA